MLANFGFLGPKLKYPAHSDWDPSAITRNSDKYIALIETKLSEKEKEILKVW